MNALFSAVLIAGGESSRMGRDKALIEIDGVPLWRRQLALLEELEPSEIFVAGPLGHGTFTFVSDAREGAGPLGGLVAALRACSTPLLLALAVDLPHMTSEFLGNLAAEGKGIVPVSDRYEPLVAVYPTSSLALAEQQLARGCYSLQEFVGCCVKAGLMTTRPIGETERELFLNLNTPADLAALVHEQ